LDSKNFFEWVESPFLLEFEVLSWTKAFGLYPIPVEVGKNFKRGPMDFLPYIGYIFEKGPTTSSLTFEVATSKGVQ
jgi:hypothetical protein